MKITPPFVLALAAASYGSASPVYKRQMSSSSSELPTPVAASSAASAATGMSSSSASGSAASASAMPPAPAAAPGDGGNSTMPNATTPDAPTGSSPSSGTRFNDTQILQYALTLEHLEATFYNQSLNKFSTSDFENAGYNGSVRNQIYSIGRDEASHVDLLTKALGNQSVPACTYDFSSVTDVQSFLTTARVLEGVDVSAYIGASQNITNGSYAEIAGSILSVEGRHASYIISQTNDGGNAIPAAYDTPLDFKQVYSLAAPFIQSCPQNASLPITAFPSLTLSGGASNGSFTPGQQVSVSFENSTSTSGGNSTSSGNQYLAIIQGVTGLQFIPLNGGSGGNSSVTLPSNLIGGQMYAVVTSSDTAVTDDNTLAGPAVGYVNIPLPQAPEATNSTSTGSAAAGAAPTGSSSSASASSSMSLGASAASIASANIPTPSATN